MVFLNLILREDGLPFVFYGCYGSWGECFHYGHVVVFQNIGVDDFMGNLQLVHSTSYFLLE